jgi:hypothetical protein
MLQVNNIKQNIQMYWLTALSGIQKDMAMRDLNNGVDL